VDETGRFGRETKREVVLVLPGLLATLLPVGEGPGDEGAQLALPPEAITAAVDELTRDRSVMSREAGQATHPRPASPKGERSMKTN
ncbi:MAG: hypothetical protein ACYC23_15975, partial [Limisphaerales bacterium]